MIRERLNEEEALIIHERCVRGARQREEAQGRGLLPEDLDAIRDRWAAASAEALAVVKRRSGNALVCSTAEVDDRVKVYRLAKYFGPDSVSNALFAANAHHDMDRLLAEIDRLRGLVGDAADVAESTALESEVAH